MSFCDDVNKPGENSPCIWKIKAFHLWTGISFCLKAVFFSGLKTGQSDTPPGIPTCLYSRFTTKNAKVGLTGSQEMHILSFEKWPWNVLTWKIDWRSIFIKWCDRKVCNVWIRTIVWNPWQYLTYFRNSK